MPSTQEEAVGVDHNTIIGDDDEEEDLEEYDDEEEDSEDDEEDEDDHHQPPIQDLLTTTTTLPLSPLPKQQYHPIAAAIATPSPSPTLTLTPVPAPKPSAIDDNRKLFQRLWTDEDEIGLLQGFLEYTSQRGGFKNSAYHHDTAPFYDQIKSRLQLDFNKSQLVEKLRRLKKKFRNIMSRINSGKDCSFKTPHDQATFDISRKIWSTGIAGGETTAVPLIMDDEDHANPLQIQLHTNGINSEKKGSSLGSRSRKRPRNGGGSSGVPTPPPPPPPAAEEIVADPLNLLNCPVNSSLPNAIEETIKSCVSPLFRELMFSTINGPSNLRGIGGMTSNILPLNFGNNLSVNASNGDGDSAKEMIDEKWRKQQILELEVYAKRVELVQDQIKLALEELRSMDSG